MIFTPRAGSYGPREPGVPGEVAVGRPMLNNVRFFKHHHLELESVGVLEELDVDPSTTH